MKKILLLACVLFGIIALPACKEETIAPMEALEIELSAENIVSVDVFYGEVPANLKKKHVVDSENIQKIVDALNEIEFLRYADESDMLVGAVGPIFSINFESGEHFVINADYTLAYYRGNAYVIEEIDLSSLFDALPYDEVLVGEAGSPSHRNSAHDYIITDIKDITITVADIVDKNNLFTFSAGEDVLFLINNEEGNIADLNVGDRIHVEHNGIIQETYPASIGEVYKVIVIDALHGTEMTKEME